MAFRIIRLLCYHQTYAIAEYGGGRGVIANYNWTQTFPFSTPFSSDAEFLLCDQLGLPVFFDGISTGSTVTLKVKSHHFLWADWANGFVKADTNNSKIAGLRIVKVRAASFVNNDDLIRDGDMVAFSSTTRLPFNTYTSRNRRSTFEREFKWLTAEPSGSRPLVTNRQNHSPYEWETFRITIQDRLFI